MTDDEEGPKPGSPLDQLIKEDLDPLSGFELEARIESLRQEIRRCQAKIEAKGADRAAAEALFKS